ncbi:hypothetical protein GCM10010470_14000 [Saccharopolyspora taberi]|uniref:Uncharacterized protein n=1 Tax=Saccharopolyspora taberi TaxID=60895 RepID=A0ABN3V712_9PSEU
MGSGLPRPLATFAVESGHSALFGQDWGAKPLPTTSLDLVVPPGLHDLCAAYGECGAQKAGGSGRDRQ